MSDVKCPCRDGRRRQSLLANGWVHIRASDSRPSQENVWYQRQALNDNYFEWYTQVLVCCVFCFSPFLIHNSFFVRMEHFDEYNFFSTYCAFFKILNVNIKRWYLSYFTTFYCGTSTCQITNVHVILKAFYRKIWLLVLLVYFISHKLEIKVQHLPDLSPFT